MKQTRTKIAFLIPGLGVVERGAENFVVELSQRLSSEFHVTIFARGNIKTLANCKNIVQIRVPALSRENVFLTFLYNLHPWMTKLMDRLFLSPQEIEMLTFTLFVSLSIIRGNFEVLFPVNGFWGGLLCLVNRRLKNTPFIYAAHGGEQPQVARLRPNVYISTTPYNYWWLKQFDRTLHVIYIPNGVDTRKFSPRVEPLPLHLEKPQFLTVAAFIPAKRLELAIKAVAHLKKGSLTLVGFGPLKESLKRLGVSLLGKKRFAILSASYSKIAHIYTAFDVFTLPSDQDPSPLVYLEAAASGIPIVAPDDKRRRAVLGRAALYAHVENTQDYARILKAAVNKKWGNVPRALALQYDWDIIAKKYILCLKQLTNQRLD